MGPLCNKKQTIKEYFCLFEGNVKDESLENDKWVFFVYLEQDNRCERLLAYPTMLSLVLSTEMVLQLLCSSTRAVVSVASLTIPT